MNDKQKQIEETAKIVCNVCEFGNGFGGECDLNRDDLNRDDRCRTALETAEKLYEVGYRKQFDVDFMEVVRCKDCMSWRGKDHDGVCIENGLATRMANEFCSRGEKKGRI